MAKLNAYLTVGEANILSKEPDRPKGQYPLLCDESGEFTGGRVDDIHLTNTERQAARARVSVA